MQNSLFDLENRYASLSKTGAPLERLNAIIDWEIFRSILERMDKKERKSQAGRKPTCRILMFKMLVLQRLNGLSDERLQYQVTERLSFMRFLGVELGGNVPDARTVWAFRESLKERHLAQALFERLNQALAEMGIELKSGQIVDATFVPVPIQRNARENNALIKAGAVPMQWGQDTEQPNKLVHKDTDARWTKKGGQVLESVLRSPDVGGKEVWADSAYRSEDQEQSLKGSEHTSQINERAYRGKPLSESQEINNKAKSRVRARVEHVFGHMENSMGGIFVRTIGIARAKVGVSLMNLTYKLSRIEVLIRNKTFGFERISAPKMAVPA
jgi:transposase, IS5 family